MLIRSPYDYCIQHFGYISFNDITISEYEVLERLYDAKNQCLQNSQKIESICFDKCKFEFNGMDFDLGRFLEWHVFSEGFSPHIQITNSTFECDFVMNNHFKSQVRIMDNIFQKKVCFNYCVFENFFVFSKNKCLDNVSFKRVQFIANEAYYTDYDNCPLIDFRNNTFDKVVNFISAFFNYPPHFEGCEIKDLWIEDAIFNNAIHPKETVSSASSSWSTLLAIVKKTDNHEWILFFSNKLIEAKHGQNRIYKYVYAPLGKGEDYAKPLLLLFLIAVVTFFMIALCYAIFGATESVLIHSLIMTIDSLLPIKFFAPTEIAAITSSLSTSGKSLILLLRILLSVISIACLFMAALGLRNKFRVK